jgi:hypothetical protein
MSEQQTTFSTKKIVETFPMKIQLALPPDKPELEGFIMCDAVVRTKPEIKQLSEEGLTDEEYLRRVVKGIHGLGHPETDAPLVGEDAFKEALEGRYSMWILGAIVDGYFAQYGEARRKNSNRRR